MREWNVELELPSIEPKCDRERTDFRLDLSHDSVEELRREIAIDSQMSNPEIMEEFIDLGLPIDDCYNPFRNMLDMNEILMSHLL